MKLVLLLLHLFLSIIPRYSTGFKVFNRFGLHYRGISEKTVVSRWPKLLLASEESRDSGYSPHQFLKTVYDGDQRLLDDILTKVYVSEPKEEPFPEAQKVPFKPEKYVDTTNEFHDLLATLNATLPAEINDYEGIKEPVVEEEVKDTSIKINYGNRLSDYDHSAEDIDDEDYEMRSSLRRTTSDYYFVRPVKEKVEVPKEELGVPSESFFIGQALALEKMTEEEFEAHGEELIENQLSINIVSKEISHNVSGLEVKYNMSIPDLKKEVMKDQAIQDRMWEAFQFISQMKEYNRTLPEAALDTERERGYVDCDHPKKIMINSRACILDGNTTAVRYILDIYDYIREHMNNDDQIGYMIELMEPVIYPDINMTDAQWEQYALAHPLVDERERIEVKDGFVSLWRRKIYVPDTPAREYPPRDPVKSAFRQVENSLQMWVEGHNMYHLINGLSMKIRFGSIMPHILNSERNRQNIVKKVRYALEEELSGDISLDHSLARVRLKGGKNVYPGGYDTHVEHPDPEEDCVVTDLDEDDAAPVDKAHHYGRNK